MRFLDKLLGDVKAGNFNQLVLDSFGNYVVQIILQLYPKIIHTLGLAAQYDVTSVALAKEGSMPRKYLDLIFECVNGNVMRYSTHKHGCRVVQTGLEVFTIDQKLAILQELLSCGRVRECSYDYNGNHVIQKIISEMGQLQPDDPATNELGLPMMQQLITEIDYEIVSFCLNEYCCRIAQRMFEFCHPDLIETSARIILHNFESLNKSEYGIFVLSSMLEHGQHRHKVALLNLVQGQSAYLAIQKDGSKLVENALKMLHRVSAKHRQNAHQLYQILDEVIYLPLRTQFAQQQVQQDRRKSNMNYQGGSVYAEDLLTNKYANYVIQTAFEVSDQQRQQQILYCIQQTLSNQPGCGKSTPLKHILKHLQKFCIHFDQQTSQPQPWQMAGNQQQQVPGFGSANPNYYQEQVYPQAQGYSTGNNGYAVMNQFDSSVQFKMNTNGKQQTFQNNAGRKRAGDLRDKAK